MRTDEFDYHLPPELIAQKPVEPRDASRLMVLNRADGSITHRIFREIGAYLRPGDLLVLNESRVIPARLFARKVPTGGRVEMLLLNPEGGNGRWRVLVKGRRVRPGTRLALTAGPEPESPTIDVEATVVAEGERGERVVVFSRPVETFLEQVGVIPLPPYIHEPLADPERYQTVYARRPGSVAAPTAGLHFTPELLLALREQGVRFAYVTLHIGLDTFRPVSTERVENHKMHSEWCQLSPETASRINRAKLEGRRVVAVGTTAVRVLETAAQRALAQCQGEACAWQTVVAFEGTTDLFITPGYRFRVVDALITNFHLPRSTLLMLVAAFAGLDLIRRAYAEAIARRYRFYSFGDAMLIL
ncbi:MAG: tRNA preQ1(34) S-adenosylmethionine ribosyltransferase-isomerase QueA [Chloroflexi bacterium]|nr:MAG: tRNA preQ1(34) S-adenosylmethionine ribosyltransferase-isomerase QueA [Chloroflexota bacterium]